MVADVRESPIHRALAREVSGRREAWLDRLFAYWFARFVYNQIWEDPRVDLEALNLTPESRIVTIASGGCNVLNYLTADAAKITAVDLNPAHIALTRLKIAALRHLPNHESFFSFFGAGDQPGNVQLYFKHIAPSLDGQTRQFWEKRTFFQARRIDYFSDGFYRKALLGRFIGFLHLAARMAGRDPSLILTADTRAQQDAIFNREIAPLFNLKIVRLLCRQPIVLYSLGIPPNQFASMRSDAGADLALLYAERIRRLACAFDLSENYFAWQAFARRYDTGRRQAIPPYLQAEHYDALRGRLDRIESRCQSMTDYLATQPAGSVDGYVLLDSVDWMDQRLLTELWAQITRTAAGGARVIFRTAGVRSVVEELLTPGDLLGWHYDAERSAELLARDRSAIYGGFHLYQRR